MHIYGWKEKCFWGKNEHLLVIFVNVTYLALDTAIPMLRWVTEDPSTEVTCMFWICPGTRLVMWHRRQRKNPQFIALEGLLSPPHINSMSWVIIPNLYHFWQIMFTLVQMNFISLYIWLLHRAIVTKCSLRCNVSLWYI